MTVSNHLVFCENPGTGKTTVARLLAQIYHAMGILSGGQFVETDRSGLVAAYPELMGQFIESNPGLKSRFNKYINFEDYNAEELFEIFKLMCSESGYSPNEDALAYAAEYFKDRYENRTKNFANARDVRNFLDAAVTRQADRLFGKEDLTNEELCSLTLEDLNAGGIVTG